jgi:TonB family protein
LHSPTEPAKRRARAAGLSFGFHLGLLAFVVLVGIQSKIIPVQPVHPLRIAQIEIAGGSHAVKIPLPPMPAASHTRQPEPNADPAKKTILPMEKTPLKKSGGGAPAAPHHGDGSSTALRGNGSDAEEVHPAFPVFSPRPPVTDRSLLPAQEQKIVVDVDVNASGEVVSESLVKGLGNKLDQLVLDIVKTWRFQPATVNGKPVPTEAELIFPFNQSYPITDS